MMSNEATKQTQIDGWTILQLKDINVSKSKSILPLSFSEEEFEYYSIPAFQETGKPEICKGEKILSNKITVENGTVLFGKLNPRVLKVWLVNSDVENRKIASTEFLPILPNAKADSEFIYYFCQSNALVNEARRLVSGSTPSRQRVDPKSFYKISINLPTLPEQKAIAKVMRSVKEAKEARQTELRLERERKNALMVYLFTHGTRGENLKQTEIGEMPESWDVVKLKDVCLKTKNVNPTKNPDDYFIYIDVSSVSNKSFKIVENNSVLGVDAPSRARKLIETNDIIFATVRPTMKRVAMIPEKLNGQVCSTGFCVVKTNPKLLVPTFAFYCLLMDRIEKSVEKLQKGASYPAISDSDLLNQLIPFPSVEEQELIAEVLQACDEKISALEKEITTLDEFFKAMLEELMNGNLSAVPLIEA